MTTHRLSPARRRQARIVAAALVVLGPLTACTATADVGEPRSAPHVTATPRLLDSTHLRLPLRPYQLADSQLDDLLAARNLLVTRCAARFGMTLPSPPRSRHLGPSTATERRYGLTDPVLAAEDGYHLGARDPRRYGKPDAPELSADQELVLDGTSPKPSPASAPARWVHGRLVPAGGCIAEADRKLGGAWDDPDVVEAIDTNSVIEATEDRRVRAIFRAWSACMKARGYGYETPWDAGNDPRFTGPHSSPAEIAVATADVACKKKTNVVGMWYAVDVAYQQVLIKREQAALDKVKDAKVVHLRLARRVLAGA